MHLVRQQCWNSGGLMPLPNGLSNQVGIFPDFELTQTKGWRYSPTQVIHVPIMCVCVCARARVHPG